MPTYSATIGTMSDYGWTRVIPTNWATSWTSDTYTIVNNAGFVSFVQDAKPSPPKELPDIDYGQWDDFMNSDFD